MGGFRSSAAGDWDVISNDFRMVMSYLMEYGVRSGDDDMIGVYKQ